jgi:hypothetical protein
MKIPEDCTVKELIQITEDNFRQYSEILNNSSEAHQPKEFLFTLVVILEEIVDYRLMDIIRIDNPYISRIEVEKIKEKSSYRNYSFTQLAETFLTQQTELLKLLHSLPVESWKRTGVYEKDGHITFKEIVRRMAEKDQQNIAKLNRMLVTH